MAVSWRESFLAANFTPQCAAGVSIPDTGCTSITPWTSLHGLHREGFHQGHVSKWEKAWSQLRIWLWCHRAWMPPPRHYMLPLPLLLPLLILWEADFSLVEFLRHVADRNLCLGHCTDRASLFALHWTANYSSSFRYNFSPMRNAYVFKSWLKDIFGWLLIWTNSIDSANRMLLSSISICWPCLVRQAYCVVNHYRV